VRGGSVRAKDARKLAHLVLVQLLLARALELFLLAFACLFSSLRHGRRLFFPLALLKGSRFLGRRVVGARQSLRFDFARVIALGAAAVSAARFPGRASAILFYLLLFQGRVCCVERLPFLLAEREADLGVGGLCVGAAALAAALRVGGEYDCAPIFAAVEAHRF